jgi:hypothetical protein
MEDHEVLFKATHVGGLRQFVIPSHEGTAKRKAWGPLVLLFFVVEPYFWSVVGIVFIFFYPYHCFVFSENCYY